MPLQGVAPFCAYDKQMVDVARFTFWEHADGRRRHSVSICGGMLATPLWPALAAAALLLFLLEIVVRRAPWSFLDGATARR